MIKKEWKKMPSPCLLPKEGDIEVRGENKSARGRQVKPFRKIR